jgi:hypothetical protein
MRNFIIYALVFVALVFLVIQFTQRGPLAEQITLSQLAKRHQD